MAPLIVKQLIIHHETVNVYLYKNKEKNHLLIAIPDVFWSFEISLATHINKINDELMMQLFTFNNEQDASTIASKLTGWIADNIKGDL